MPNLGGLSLLFFVVFDITEIYFEDFTVDEISVVAHITTKKKKSCLEITSGKLISRKTTLDICQLFQG